MKTKRIISAVIAAALCLGCAVGCSDKDGDTASNDQSTASTASDSAAETKQEVNMEIRDIPSVELVKEMTIGWNLGNTMDATGNSGVEAETSWQPDKTSEAMMKLLADTGINVLRLPVSWGEHVDEDFKVDEAWMARVHEIVDYGINNGLFVILDTHHEEWYFPKEEQKEQDIEHIKTLWSQIAEEFKGYDEHLIFEGLNEPRCRNTPMEWTGGDDTSRAIVAEYAKAFYETVRASGGNNEKRHLMLTGYAASSNRNCLESVWLPENDDKVIVSVHGYLPYSLCLDTAGTDEWDPNNTYEIDNLFNNLDELFLSKNIPVIIGEFGSVNKDNIDDRLACLEYYVGKGVEYGVPMVWWDNNATVGAGENFGIMDRSLIPEWRFPEIAEKMAELTKK